jgi:hypothetical protein
MSPGEVEYRQLRRLDGPERVAWLVEHQPRDLRGHWWLSLIERAEIDAWPSNASPPDERRSNLEFAIDLIELAEAHGMPARHVVTRLARLASSYLKAGWVGNQLPSAIEPDALARRILATFRFDLDEAPRVATRVRAEGRANAPADAEIEALQDIGWLIGDLELIVPFISDDDIKAEVAAWIDLAPRLSIV